jgi:5'-3' exonuclease
MGIPSYFSYIINNYPKIIENIKNHNTSTDSLDASPAPVRPTSLYMDCNSIIYDVFYSLDISSYKNTDDFENELILLIISKIHKYIITINPTRFLFIAFDGVAPFAKMDQQRNRRYKSLFQTDLDNSYGDKPISKSNIVWNTSHITPGTLFMDKLSTQISSALCNKELYYNVSSIIVSGSLVAGEGEHKMFSHIRKNPFLDDNIYVYGLDSDLIMLSIFHCSKFCKNIFIFREMPNFSNVKSNNAKSNNELAFMRIDLLSSSILNEMNDQNNKTEGFNRIYDYVFLCFFLGNDFLPHFPALNIRTTGIQVLIDTYKLHISGEHGQEVERGFINSANCSINWKWVFLFITELGKIENALFLTESNTRDKLDNRKWAQTTIVDKKQLVLNIPSIYRSEEKYICPTQPLWEDRYYSALFSNTYDNTPIIITNICRNYMEGLEWVFKYYTVDCPHWRWKYNYNYPPLLTDLSAFISNINENCCYFINKLPYKNEPFLPNVQLSYVIPYKFHYLLDDITRTRIQCDIKEVHNPKFQWAYCRYFWESHILLPDISVELLDEWTDDLIKPII